MAKISVNNELEMKEEWDSEFQITNTANEGKKDGVEKGKCLFFAETIKEHIYCYTVRKPKMASEVR